MLLECVGSLELFSSSEPDSRQSQRQSLRSHHETRMHQYAAHGVVPRAAHSSDMTLTQLPGCSTVVPVVRKLRRVMQCQCDLIGRYKSLARALEVAR